MIEAPDPGCTPCLGQEVEVIPEEWNLYYPMQLDLDYGRSDWDDYCFDIDEGQSHPTEPLTLIAGQVSQGKALGLLSWGSPPCTKDLTPHRRGMLFKSGFYWKVEGKSKESPIRGGIFNRAKFRG